MLVLALAVASPASAAKPRGVESAGGTIRCVVSHATLFCTVAGATYAPQLQARCASPGGGGLDWHGWTLRSRGAARISCSGGALWFGTPRYTRLAVDSTWRLGPFGCSAARSGLTCRNRGGHGLFLSRASWRAW